jgi:predicted membrane chloride channel (bestrophin family)
LYRKLNETPFPFPWAQGIIVVLIMFTVSVPFVFAVFIDNTIVAAFASFIAVQTYIMMNEVANDVEDPFHYDPNQLPLPQMQYRLNERLLAVSKTERPLAFTDVGAIDGPSNIPQLPPVRSPALFLAEISLYWSVALLL